jgi:putative ubiquitin-RnfH superfamily antitoxin RatB of RatAB toxin-antitoxin module
MVTAEHATLIAVTVVTNPAAGQLQQVDLQLPLGALVRDALLRSGLCPQTDGVVLKVGVWGQLRSLDHVLRDRDRVEVYRPLRIEPKEARRLRYRQQRCAPR